MNIKSQNYYSPSFGTRQWKAEYSKPFQDAIKKHEIILLDTDIIKGFMEPQSAPRIGLPVPDAESIRNNIQIGTDAAKRAKMLQVNNLDAHRKGDPEDNLFLAFCDQHCVEGTAGAEIIPEAKIESNNYLKISRDTEINDLPAFETVDKFVKNGGVIDIQKNTNGIGNEGIGYDPVNDKEIIARNAKPYKLFKDLKDAGVKAALVRGVATDYCVKLAVKFLKEMDIRPIVVEDAIKEIQYGINAPEMKNIYDDVITISTKQMNEEINAALA
jgi:nicotinamidase-related amidase